MAQKRVARPDGKAIPTEGNALVVAGYWDSELEQLVARVVDVFGEPTASAAVDRAAWRCQTCLGDCEAHLAVLIQMYQVTLKAELRGLLKPH